MSALPRNGTDKSHIVAPTNCTGCGLCANVCPKNAISMVWSHEGFPIPAVDENRCIECGLCVKRCIALEAPPEYKDAMEGVESYGAWHQNAAWHRSSSSGGVFSALAEFIFARGGCVFGVAWQDKQTAVFRKAESMEELEPLRGSKYTPALPGYVYRDVRDELRAGRQVLFSGTPCQVHALKSFLKKPYERLVTMDIACHGVPSRLILQKYIREEELRAGCPLESISFRDKSTGWVSGGYSLLHRFSNGERFYRRQGESLFMRMFLCDAALNRSCYSCPYAHVPRQGDISVGDYWGVEEYHPDWPLNDGVSTLIVTTERGREVLQQMAGELHLHAEPFAHICKHNRHVYTKTGQVIHPGRCHALARLRDEQASLQDALEAATCYVTIKGVRFRNDSLMMRLLRKMKHCVLATLRGKS